MSYTEVLGLNPPTNEVIELAEYRNGHGFLPPVWTGITARYLPGEKYWYEVTESQIWDLTKNPDVPKHHRAILLLTGEGAYIRKENYERAASDIEQFFNDMPYVPGYVNHWGKIVKLLRTSPEYSAIGFYGSSVNGDCIWFPHKGHCAKCDHECEPGIDWETAYEIYEELES